MLIIRNSVCLVLLVSALAACSASQPVATGPLQPAWPFEPAPTPYLSRPPAPSTTGSLTIPFAPKAPAGTGAVPVSSSPVRGSLVTGLQESF